MGVGMVAIVSAAHADDALSALRTGGEPAWLLGEVT
jgi:phosphoribosylaminoimidazole (AIR) synthetase